MRSRVLSRRARRRCCCHRTSGSCTTRKLGFEPLEDRRLLSAVGFEANLPADEAAAASRILYVDVDATGNDDGSSWTDAYDHLQDALAATVAGDEIRVAEGVYTPAEPGGDRNATFQLATGVTIAGGYAGVGQPAPDLRDIRGHQTILSGDLNGDDGPNFAGNGENSIHVVTGSGCDETAVLDGFTITDGNANGSVWQVSDGGGMYTYAGSPTLINCAFVGNSADLGGGGMYNREYSNPTLVNCLFTGNVSWGFGGGGISNQDSSCPTLVNCTFSGNSAEHSGTAMYNWNHSVPTLTNSIVWGNTARSSGTEEVPIGGWTPVVSYSCIQDADPNDEDVFSGTGNIDDDPLFAEALGADNVGGTEDENLRLLPGSPCLDAGNNAAVPPSLPTDLDAGPRVIGGTVDMGAYEFIGALPIVVGDRWTYFKGIEEPPVDWNQLSFDDASWESGPTGIGYGDGDDATVLADMEDTYISVYARRLFHVEDPAVLTSLTLTMDYDDGFVAYLNGVRVAGENVDGNPPAFDTPASDDHEASGGSGNPNPPETFDISGFIGRLSPGANVLAVQGHNDSLDSSDLSLIASLAARPAVVYVDDDAPNDPGPGDPDLGDPLENGTAAHPFDAIQEAIDDAGDGDVVIVLDGTYTGAGNRDIDFLGKAITVRSAGGPQNCIIDSQGSEQEPHRGFYFHNGEDEDSVLEGFTITGGNRPESTWLNTNGGGGILAHGSPVIRDNWIIGNSAYFGGGIAAWGSPAISENLIADNVAVDGGGINCYESVTIANNTITQNTAQRGGGIWTWEDGPATIVNNTISENWADSAGGGIGILWDDGPVIAGNLIVDNGTGGAGGGIYLSTGDVTIVNNTIVENTAVNGGGMHQLFGTPDITNCIIWDNGDDLDGCSATYSCIQDIDPGEGNIHGDPLFADPAAGNYRLAETSPCLDAGNNATVPSWMSEDLDGHSRIVDGTVDMGAYESATALPVDRFGFSTIDSPQHVGTPFSVTITALDAYDCTVTEFCNAISLGGRIVTPTDSTIVVSEIDAHSPDLVEFANVSGHGVDVSNWQVLIYDRNSETSPLPTFTIPAGTLCPAGEVFLVEQNGTAPGAYPHFYTGEGISFRPTGSAGVLLLDAAGEVVDFVAVGELDPTEITDPLTVVPDYWQGAQVPSLPDDTVSYQRVGDSDNDNAGDWTPAAASTGIVHTALTVPFADEVTPVAVAPVVTGNFVNGVWTGDVTVLEEAAGMHLWADRGQGEIGTGNTFDVEISPAEIRGSKWNDLDGDGEWDSDEPGLPGWKIYIDENDSGGWDAGEPFDLTDANGDYAITGLSAGTHLVGGVFRDNWEQTFPGIGGGGAAMSQGVGVVSSPEPTLPPIGPDTIGHGAIGSGTIGGMSEELESFRATFSDSAVDSEEIDTSWINGSGPSALQNLDWQPFPKTAMLASELLFAETGVFNVYVEQGLLSAIDVSLGTYVSDLTAEGYQVSVEEFSGTSDQLRSELQYEWTNNALEGALFVGDLPHLTFASEDNYSSTPVRVTYPHDLYFMDLDGSYVFNPGGLDEHTNGSGDVDPEIYVSRITTGNLGGITGQDEAALINRYFDKVHAYRIGDLSFENRGIVFADDDWRHWGASQMTSLYGEVLAVNSLAETTKQGYLDTLQLDYESILECIHSSPTRHSVRVGTSGESITSQEIVDANPRQGFYNMFNCSSARFTSSNHLAGAYVYGGDYGLNAVGTTKTGSMLAFGDFYGPQGQGDSVGQAFLQWFQAHAAGTDTGPDSYVDWFYGMTMQGDPTLRPASMPGDRTGTHVVELEAGQTVENIHFGSHAEIDFGDAPDPTYPTLAASNGAGHVLAPDGPLMGTAVDADPNGRPLPNASGDDNDGNDDEDGIALTTAVTAGDPAAGVDVDMTASPSDGLLSAWIDFNADGDWDDNGEEIFTDEPLAAGIVNSLTYAVPPGANSGETFARFRVSSEGGLSHGGLADDGEVEDYGVVVNTVTDTPDLVAAFDTGLLDDDNVTNLDNGTTGNVLQFTVGGTIAGATVKVYADGTEIGAATATGASTVVITNGENDLADGLHSITSRQTPPGSPESPDSAALIVRVDTQAPNAVGDVVNEGQAQRSNVHWLTIRFDEPVNVSGVTALSVINDTTGETADIGNAVLLDNDTDEVGWDLWSTGTSLLEDGYQTAGLSTSGVTDVAGNPLAAEHQVLFHRLLGDLDGNCRVNFGDFSLLAQNFDPLAGEPHRTGDVNGDGRVNFGDFSTLSSHFDPIGLPPRSPSPPHGSQSVARLTAAAVDQVLREEADGEDDEQSEFPAIASSPLLLPH